MEILERESDIGPATALTRNERKRLVEFAEINKSDIFYDLGSGHGQVVFDIINYTRAKRAVGIELDYRRFSYSVCKAKEILPRRELKKTDFYCASYELYDISDATVIYEGHERSKHEVEFFSHWFKNKKVKIIAMDLPMIGCLPVTSTTNRGLKFFMVTTPLRVSSNPNKWASCVLGSDATTFDIYSRYDEILRNRGFGKSSRGKAVANLKSIVRSTFTKRHKSSASS